MAEQQTEIETTLVDLSDEAFEVFVDDIATMFDIGTSGKQATVSTGKISDLKKQYRKKCGLWSIKAEGVVNGTFYMVVKNEGLFTLAGTFVMQPEQIITQNRNRGDEKTLKELDDAITEVGNLMVGSWDRTFRESSDGKHGHFVQSGTILDNPWQKVKDTGLDDEDELFIITYEMVVEPFDAFECSIIYPKKALTGQAEQETLIEAEPEQPQETPAKEEPSTQPESAENKTEAEDTKEQPEQDDKDKQSDEKTPPAKDDAPVEDTASAKDDTPIKDGPVSQAIQNLVHPGDPSFKGMTVKDVMSAAVVWAKSEDTVEQVFNLTQQQGVDCVLIGSVEKLEGIVSNSDIQGAMSPYLRSMFSKWKRPQDLASLQIKVKWIMSKPVRTVMPGASISDAAKNMCEHKIGSLPVVDEQGKVQGLITAFDILRLI